MKAKIRVMWIILLALTGCSSGYDQSLVRIGSKKFTESEVLGEMLVHLAKDAGAGTEHRKALGDTIVVWNGLLIGELDAYCEYTGTLTQDILAREKIVNEPALKASLAALGLRMGQPLGFNNSYAIGMRKDRATELGISKVSDLAKHPELKFGLSNPFLHREKDGWEPLRRRYGLPQQTPNGLEHDLAVKGVFRGDFDVTDIYATDAKVKQYDLQLLEDDLHFFPRYDAVVLYRADLEERFPDVVKSFQQLEGRLPDETMARLNAEVDVDQKHEAQVAADFLDGELGIKSEVSTAGLGRRLYDTTKQHLLLVAASLALAVITAVPLGIIAARRQRLGQAILAIVGIVQTIPAVALLVVLLALGTGFGARTAILALFLYSLLPIVRNTYTGLHDIPLQIRESADALGLSSWSRLYLIELPMASRSILAGLKTAAVINVGNATLGGLIDAGGYGGPIFTGLNRDNLRFTLEGAIPAILLALVVQGFFELSERFLVPKGLRLRPVGEGRDDS